MKNLSNHKNSYLQSNHDCKNNPIELFLNSVPDNKIIKNDSNLINNKNALDNDSILSISNQKKPEESFQTNNKNKKFSNSNIKKLSIIEEINSIIHNQTSLKSNLSINNKAPHLSQPNIPLESSFAEVRKNIFIMLKIFNYIMLVLT